jgi:hypothetical protein
MKDYIVRFGDFNLIIPFCVFSVKISVFECFKPLRHFYTMAEIALS